MIKLQVIGSLGKDAEIKTIGNENYLSFSIAHNEQYQDRQGKQVSNTVWVDVLKSDKSGKLINYLKKGTKIYVCGKPKVNPYLSNSEAKASLSLYASELELLSSMQSQQSQHSESDNTPIDDLPF